MNAGDLLPYCFEHREIVEELIRLRGIHKGLWRLSVEVGLVGNNMNVLKDGKTTLTPAATVLIGRIGIVQAKELDDLTVDAAEVNPRIPPPKKSRKRSKKSAK